MPDKDATDRLADVLQDLASKIGGSSTVGLHVIAKGGPSQSGPVTGVHVIAAGGGPGSVTGMHIEVSNGQESQTERHLMSELLDAARTLRSGSAPRSWVTGLIDRVQALGGEAAKAATAESIKELVQHAFGPM